MAPSPADIQREIDRAPVGSTVHLPAGPVDGPLIIARPVILFGQGPDRTVIRGRDEGPAVAVDATGGLVRLEGLQVTGGRYGGGVSVDNGARVEMANCQINDNQAGRGGGLSVDFGSVRLERVRFQNNRAELGGALYVGGEAQLFGEDLVFVGNQAERGGAAAVVEAACLELRTSILEADNRAAKKGHLIFAGGAPGRTARLVLDRVQFRAPFDVEVMSVWRETDFPPGVEARDTVWPTDSGPPPRRRKIRIS